MLKRTILNTVGSTALLVCISLGSVVPAYAFEGANQIVSGSHSGIESPEH